MNTIGPVAVIAAGIFLGYILESGRGQALLTALGFQPAGANAATGTGGTGTATSTSGGATPVVSAEVPGWLTSLQNANQATLVSQLGITTPGMSQTAGMVPDNGFGPTVAYGGV